MTESFEDAMAFMRKAITDDCDQTYCAMYDDDCYACERAVLDRLQRAHEREMDAVRDPQRIGGRHALDSFVYAIEQLREFRWQHATNDDDAIPYINGVAKAHEHEMEQLRRSRFREGYEAGQRSMDAEHQAVASKVMQVPYDDDAMEFLFHISAIICGGYYTSNKLLRDELVRLLGGVHDEPAQTAASSCACDADCDCGHGDETEVRITNELRKWMDLVLTADDQAWDIADRIDENVSKIAYNVKMWHDRADDMRKERGVLGDERHKVVCELRNVRDKMSDSMADNVSRIIYAIGARPKVGERACEAIADRLIHLLGGDEPADSPIETLVKSTEELSRQGKVRFPPNEDGSIEGLKTVEETAALIDEVKRRAKSCKSGETIKSEGECDGKIMKSVENHQIEATITDELRKFATDPLLGYASQELHAERITAIADRIDEQFKRICLQQEAVLQQTIDTMVDERDKLAENRDMWRGKAMQLTDVVDRYVGRYEDVLELLRDAAKDYKQLRKAYGVAYGLAKYWRRMDKGELFELLRDAAGDYEAVLFERDEWRHSAEHEADKRKEYKGLFERYRDSYVEYVGRYNIVVRECEELRKSLRMIAERIGVPHHRSLSMYGDEALREVILDAIDSKNEHIGALEWQRDRQRKLLDEYERRDTAKDIVRDIHLGKVTDTQAVERIRALNG